MAEESLITPLDKLMSQGKELGLTGDELRKFVEGQQAAEREERAARRQFEKEQSEAKRQYEKEQAKIQLEKEQAKIRLELSLSLWQENCYFIILQTNSAIQRCTT